MATRFSNEGMGTPVPSAHFSTMAEPPQARIGRRCPVLPKGMAGMVSRSVICRAGGAAPAAANPANKSLRVNMDQVNLRTLELCRTTEPLVTRQARISLIGSDCIAFTMCDWVGFCDHV